MFNKIILIGNITKDVELRQTPNGSSVVSINLASNRKWKDSAGNQKEEVCFIEASAFGKTAETIAKFFKKGNPILVEGRLILQQWTDKDGGKRSKHIIGIDSFQFMSYGKKEEEVQETQIEDGNDIF